MKLHYSPLASFLAAILCLMHLQGCRTAPPVGDPLNTLGSGPIAPDEIRWPPKYQPKDAVFTLSNQIEISAPPERVWEILVEAKQWPQWYEGAQNVIVQTPQGDERLTNEAVFTWETMGEDLTSRVVEYEPPYRLAFESRKWSLKAYHAWLLIPTQTGTRVVTAESQYGLLARLQRIFQPKTLSDLHDVWLAEMKKKAEGSTTPAQADE
jgi:uncharacterized protein YndB with AHSA1/START domain